MIPLTLHGRVNEIDGNNLFLEDRSYSIFLDFAPTGYGQEMEERGRIQPGHVLTSFSVLLNITGELA